MSTAKLFRFLLISSAAVSALAACTTYVRVPGVCPSDPYCLTDGSEPTVAAKVREQKFARRVMATTVDIRVIRHLPNVGRTTTQLVGVLLSSKGYVLTARANFQDAEVITVTLRTPTADGRFTAGREMAAIPLIVDNQDGVVLLALDKGEILPPSITVRFDRTITHDRVWFYGAGTALAGGHVTGTFMENDGHPSDFADADIASKRGDMGAPIVNICGELVGIAVGPYGKKGALRLIPIDLALDHLHVTRADLR
jgi:S1-C subfamily serine protease